VKSPRLPSALVIAVDAVLVVAFCVIGRRSHAEGILGDLPGLGSTLWPFLVAVLVAHVVVRLAKLPADRWTAGGVVWAVTVVLGLVLRAISGQGTAPSFMIVTTLVLALFLIGWRLIVALVRRMRARPRS